jgi:hypothetical protein
MMDSHASRDEWLGIHIAEYASSGLQVYNEGFVNAWLDDEYNLYRKSSPT